MTRRADPQQGTWYLVTAPMTILGHEPDTEFCDTIEPALEQRLLNRGQLQILSRSTKSSGRPARPAGAKPGTRRASADTHNGGAK